MVKGKDYWVVELSDVKIAEKPIQLGKDKNKIIINILHHTPHRHFMRIEDGLKIQ